MITEKYYINPERKKLKDEGQSEYTQGVMTLSPPGEIRKSDERGSIITNLGQWLI